MFQSSLCRRHGCFHRRHIAVAGAAIATITVTAAAVAVVMMLLLQQSLLWGGCRH